jgi:hypothetical protein
MEGLLTRERVPRHGRHFSLPEGRCALAMEDRAALVRRPTGPLPSSPELQQFIDAVIIPALLERLLREHEPAA